MHTIWLQIFVKQYFHEFHNDNENFCHELFLKQLMVQDFTAQNHKNLRNHENMHNRENIRPQKFGAIWY